MPRLLLLFAFVLVGSAPAWAQIPPFSAPVTDTLSRTRSQVQTLHRQTRSRMLGTLNASQRTLLAHVAGELVTSQHPDFAASASTLNQALDAREKQTLLQAQNDEIAAVQRIIRSALSESRLPFRPAEQPLKTTKESNAGAALLRSTLLVGDGIGN